MNLYAASVLDWAERGITVRLETAFPHTGVATLQITAAVPTEATIRLRRPGWSAGMEVDVDGSPVDVENAPVPDGGLTDSGYVSIRRIWDGTATVTVSLEMRLRAEHLPDGSPWVSFVFGPVVLAARAGVDGVGSFEAPDERMGHVPAGTLLPLAGTPVVAAPDPLNAVALSDRAAITAELTAVDADGGTRRVLLEPFAGIHDERYTVYWPTGPAGGRFAELRALDQATAAQGEIIDAVVAGEQQPESDHSFTGDSTRAAGREGIHWRSATGWFSYTLADPEARATLLRVRFRAAGDRAHELRLNGVPLSGPVRCVRDGEEEVVDFEVPDQVRNHDGGQLVFAVHARPGCITGDLLSVQLLKTA